MIRQCLHWIVVSLIVSIVILHGPISAAEKNSCTICHGPHPTVQSYQSFVMEILGSIQTMATAGDNTGSYGPPGLFVNGALPAANSTIAPYAFRQGAKNLKQAAQSAIIISQIFATEPFMILFTDIVPGISSARSNSTVQRDLDMLRDIDQLITEKKLQLGLGGAYGDIIQEKERIKLHQIANTYEGRLLHGDKEKASFQVHTQTSYGELLELLQLTQAKMKWRITYGIDDSFMNSNGSARRLAVDRASLAFDVDAMRQMDEGYQCVRGLINQCDSNMQSFGKEIGNAAKKGSKETRASLERFVQATRKLGVTLRNAQITSSRTDALDELCNQGNIAACQGAAVIRDSNGPQGHTNKRIRVQLDGLQGAKTAKNNQQGTKKSTAETTNTASQSVKHRIKNLEQQQKAQPLPPSVQTNKSRSLSLQESMDLLLQETLESYNKSQQIASSSNVIDITSRIPTLCTSVTLAEQMIGNKDAKQSIVQNLGIACEKQCVNAGGICRK